MTLEQLRYLQAIVRHGSFRAAAEALFKSQSSLSVGIQKLERELGFPLFTRDHYRPILTPEGEAIYQSAKQVLNKSTALQSLATHLASGVEAEVKLAISVILPIEPLIDVLNRVNRAYPKTRMNISVENLNGTMERLHDDEADMILTDVLEPDTGIESVAVTQVALVSVVSGQSRLATLADSLTEQDMEHETLIVVRDTSHHSPRISKGILDGAPQWVVNDFDTKKRIICSGQGWGRMPLHMVRHELASGKLVQLNASGFAPVKVPVFLARNRNRPAGTVAHMLWEALQHVQWNG